MNKNITKNLIAVVSALVLVVIAGNKAVYAAHCESTYGGGEDCYYNKRFQIDKDVRRITVHKDGSTETGEWEEDKVTGVSEKDIVEFRIKIKNLSDEEAGSFDDMKMEDFLPDALIREGGSGLTEYWDDFEPGETKTFTIKAKIDSDEFDRDDDFEKCVVNKAEVRWDGNYEGSDTVAVCYGNKEPTELPKTGAVSELAIVGIGLLTAGLLLKLSKRLAKANIK